MAVKTYLLTIEYNDETEEIEYIQEEIIADEPKESKSIGVVNLNKDMRFNKETLEFIRKYYTGEIGES